MKIPDKSIEYIKNGISKMKIGDDITIVLNNTGNNGKVDVQKTNEKKTTKDQVIADVKALAKDIHHGKIVIKMDNGNNPVISIINRERFKKND